MSALPAGPIAEIVEDATSEYFAYLGLVNGRTVCRRPEIVCAPSGSDYYRIMRARFPVSEADGIIGRITARLDARGADGVWYLSPMSAPELSDILPMHGFSYLKDWKSMAIGLTGPLPAGTAPPGLEIRMAERRADLDAWAGVMLAGFGFDDPGSEAFGRFVAARGTTAGVGQRHYLGVLDGRPVATAALVLGRAAAGAYWVSTLPDARGRGAATAMMGHVLREAKAAGYGVVTLNATGAGHPLYSRMGFADCFTTAIYHRPPGGVAEK
ncbi:MAG: Acetyltransferase (GNAT) family protein [Methanocella sp. PtaU1.Bin125]|nr:MAG: Acetyltransferase (GNAT) family protein [Methanocella sp. PtaU1.Bin125]